MSVLERTIAFFSPKTALKRQVNQTQIDILNSMGFGNHAASRTSRGLAGWLTSAGSPDDDITRNLATLRERSRDLYMGASLASGALKTMRTNVVGSGLKLNSQINYEFLGLTEEQAREWEANTEREFYLWADNPSECDAGRTLTFDRLQAVAFMSTLLSGEVFALTPVIKNTGCTYGLKVFLLEADYIDSPLTPEYLTKDIQSGIEIDQFGAPVAYYVANRHPADTSNPAPVKYNRILAFGRRSGRRNVLHIMADIDRPRQRRGAPVLAAVFEDLKQLDRYQKAELMAAVVNGFMTVFIESETPDSPLGDAISDELKLTDDDSIYEMGNGNIVALNPGEKANAIAPGRPNPVFEAFVTAVCRQIGVALEIPHDLLMKSFNNSYSASRAALLEAWKMFRQRRGWFAKEYCQPIYEQWLAEAVSSGRISAPGFFSDPALRSAWCGADWYGPAPGQINPFDEAQAAKIRIDEELSTRSREAAEISGLDWSATHRRRASEENRRREDSTIILKAGETIPGWSEQFAQPSPPANPQEGGKQNARSTNK